MKTWFTAKELATLGLPGLGASERHVRRVAEEQGWAGRTNTAGKRLTRARAGRGGGAEHHYTLLPPAAVAALAARGMVGAPTEVADRAPRSEAWAAFDALPEAKKDVARRRLAVLEEIEALIRAGYTVNGAVAHVVATHRARAASGVGEAFSSATAFNWLKLVKGLRRDDRLPALAPRTQGRTTTTDCDGEAFEYLKGDFLRLAKPTFEACYDRLQATAASQGWSVPSARTLRRRLEREVPAPVQVLAREGVEALERMFPPMTRDRSEFRALQAVNADGHKWDVFVRFPDGTVGRPMMIALQDLYSNKLLAWRIGRSESADLVQLALGDLFRDHGVPDLCWLDNGRGFASKWITGGAPTRYRFKVKPSDPIGVLTQLGVQVHWTRPYSGRSKPIERAFRDLCDHGARHPAFEGAYTGNKPDAKPENYGSKAVPLDVFERVVGQVIAAHNAKSGRRTRVCRGVLSFDEAYAESVATGLVRRATEAQLRMCLMAAEQVTADRQTGAVTLLGNVYWSEFLTERRGERLTVRFDPARLHDLPVEVYSATGAHLGPAQLQAAEGFADVEAARAHARAGAEWRKANKAMLEMERRLSAAQVAALLPEVIDDEPPVQPAAVRLITTPGAAAVRAASAPQESLIDRYAAALATEQRRQGLRLVE